MMSSYLNATCMSLVERKKLQWAKEREELQRLAGTWRSQESHFDNNFDRIKHTSSKEPPSTAPSRNTLPPLQKTQYPSNPYDRGGFSSGYGSDQHSPERLYNQPTKNEYSESYSHNIDNRRQSQNCGYESSSSFREDRPKWGDRGVGVAKFWQPKSDDCVERSDPPNWVRRGLNGGEIEVASSSPTESPPLEDDRPYTSGSGYSHSHSNNRSFIRGQNIPVDSVELAERERRRQMAILHQQAIKQQLEERERKKKEERDRILREEREEELRIQRDKEIERKRREAEEKIKLEKMERERKRKEAIQEAIEIAERETRLQKMKQKINRSNISENVEEKEKIVEHTPIEILESNITNEEEVLNNSKCPKQQVEQVNVSHCKEINNNLVETSEPSSSFDSNNTGCAVSSYQEPQTPIRSQDNVALILQSPNNVMESLQNFQYALIVPTPFHMNSLVPQSTERSYNNISSNTSRTENRVLTPTQYRNNKRVCDSSTQTDFYDNIPSASSSTNNSNSNSIDRIKEKLTNIELGYENNKKYRRESIEERPKWGANRPPTRYMKQSEKDLLYQKKKNSRSKTRETTVSSDDSQCNSPTRSYRRRGYVSKRATWRKNDEIYTRNIKMYQTELVPLESNKQEIYYKCCCICSCKKHKCGQNLKVDILKIEHNSPRDDKNNVLPNSVDSDSNNKDILERLTSLHNGLLIEQERWENSPRTPTLSNNN